jgi:hypothetical protein
MLRYKSTFYTVDIPETLADLTDELTPQAEELQVLADEIAAYLSPANTDAIDSFPDYTFPQTIELSKNPMLIASLDPEVLAAQHSLPLDQLLEMQTSYVNDFNKTLAPVSATPGAPVLWPVDQKSADSLFKLMKNPPLNFGDPAKVNGFLKGLGGLKTAYTEKASQIRSAFDKIAGLNKSVSIDSAMGLCKLNLSTNILSMQKMGLIMRDAHLSSTSFGGFLKSNPLDTLKSNPLSTLKTKLGGFKV